MTTKELLWLACKDKTCCHNTKVIITGKDMWRIGRALELSPWDFTRYCEAIPEAADAFRLTPDGESYQIVLGKKGRTTRHGSACIFLWKLADGHAQCGLGELRPRVCAAYPAILVDGLLCADSGCCSCRRWSTADLDEEADRGLLQRVLDDAAEYSEIVEQWNAVLSTGRTYPEYCRHVCGAYSRLHGGVE